MVYAEQHAGSPIGGEPATVEAIYRAFTHIQLRSTADAGVARVLGLGDFVGPRPRITRDLSILGGDPLHGAGVTRASWLLDLPDSASASAADRATFRGVQLARTRDQLLDNLRRYAGGDTWTVEIRGYDPASNGDVAWWQSGRAAADATYVNTWPAFRASDNPVGPNDTPPNMGIDLTPPLPGLPSVRGAGWWLGAAGAGLALWYLGPALLAAGGAVLTRSAPAPARRRRRAR